MGRNKGVEKHDVDTHSQANTIERLSLSTHARNVFDEMPDSVPDLDVEQPKPHSTSYAKLHSVPVRGNRVKLEAKQLDTTWEFCLVGHCFEIISSNHGLGRLCNYWSVPCKPFAHDSGWFVFKFESEQDRERVLLGGPYTLSGRTLYLKPMPPCFEFDGNPLASIPVWIKLPSLPLECWNPAALSVIASAVGKPISTDINTLTKEMISHARVLVEVDGSAELVTSIEIHLPNGVIRQQHVEYEGSVPK